MQQNRYRPRNVGWIESIGTSALAATAIDGCLYLCTGKIGLYVFQVFLWFTAVGVVWALFSGSSGGHPIWKSIVGRLLALIPPTLAFGAVICNYFGVLTFTHLFVAGAVSLVMSGVVWVVGRQTKT